MWPHDRNFKEYSVCKCVKLTQFQKLACKQLKRNFICRKDVLFNTNWMIAVEFICDYQSSVCPLET